MTLHVPDVGARRRLSAAAQEHGQLRPVLGGAEAWPDALDDVRTDLASADRDLDEALWVLTSGGRLPDAHLGDSVELRDHLAQVRPELPVEAAASFERYLDSMDGLRALARLLGASGASPERD